MELGKEDKTNFWIVCSCLGSVSGSSDVHMPKATCGFVGYLLVFCVSVC